MSVRARLIPKAGRGRHLHYSQAIIQTVMRRVKEREKGGKYQIGALLVWRFAFPLLHDGKEVENAHLQRCTTKRRKEMSIERELSWVEGSLLITEPIFSDKLLLINLK